MSDITESGIKRACLSMVNWAYMPGSDWFLTALRFPGVREGVLYQGDGGTPCFNGNNQIVAFGSRCSSYLLGGHQQIIAQYFAPITAETQSWIHSSLEAQERKGSTTQAIKALEDFCKRFVAHS